MEKSSELKLNQDLENNGKLLILEIYLHSIVFKVLASCEDEKYQFFATFRVSDSICFDISSSSELKNNNIVKFKNGKSCLFYLPGDYPIDEDGLSVEIEVWQKLTSSYVPSKLLIGTGKIHIPDKFITHFDDENENFPDKLDLKQYSCVNAINEKVLVMNMTVTVTNLGQNLISQYRFLMDKSYLHISDGSKYKISQSFQKTAPEAEASDEKCCFCHNEIWPTTKSTKRNSSQLSNCFEEIGTVINGNEIKIRMPKRKKKYTSEASINNGNGETQQLDKEYHESTQNKFFLNMTDDFSKLGEDHSPFSTQVAYANDKEQILTISPNNIPPGVETLKVMHPNKDVFLLRLKKKSKLSADNKVNLELEFVTPKRPIKNVTPRLETRETQYDDKDIINEKNNVTVDVIDNLPQEKVNIKQTVKKHKEKKPKKKNMKSKGKWT